MSNPKQDVVLSLPTDFTAEDERASHMGAGERIAARTAFMARQPFEAYERRIIGPLFAEIFSHLSQMAAVVEELATQAKL